MTEDKVIIDKIIKGEELSDGDYSDVVYGYVEGVGVIHEEITDTGRWENFKYTVVEVDGRFFATHWAEAATEMQEDNYYNKTFEEVYPKEVKTTIYVTEEQ